MYKGFKIIRRRNKDMKLKKIKVEQLFGTYDYEIKLNDKELVTDM